MNFNCPECAQSVEVEGRYIGKIANCPYCKSEIEVPAVPGGPPEVEVPVSRHREHPEHPSWTQLPWKRSASVPNALRIALLVTGLVIATLLFRIERYLAAIPTVADYYAEKGETPPSESTTAEQNAPLFAIKDGVEIRNTVEVEVGNLATDPVPVKVRE